MKAVITLFHYIFQLPNILIIPVLLLDFFFLLNADYVNDILLLSFCIPKSFSNPIKYNLLVPSKSDSKDYLSKLLLFTKLLIFTGLIKFLLCDFLRELDEIVLLVFYGDQMMVLFRQEGAVQILSLSYLKSYLSAFFSKWIRISVKLAFLHKTSLILCISPSA